MRVATSLFHDDGWQCNNPRRRRCAVLALRQFAGGDQLAGHDAGFQCACDRRRFSRRTRKRARLLVRTSAESGVSERVLMAPSCSKLVDTLAVAILTNFSAPTGADSSRKATKRAVKG